MLTCLFWNINGVASGGNKPLSPTDKRYQDLSKMLVAEVNNPSAYSPLDIVILAESPFKTQLALLGMASAPTLLPPNAKTKCSLEIYYRVNTVVLTDLGIFGRTTFQRVFHKTSGETLLLVAAHLESPQREERGEDRKEAVQNLTTHIASVEQREQSTRTMLIGDLNYDPFDLPVYGANYLHAIPTKELAKQQQRKVHGKQRIFFYNPMWAHFGDTFGKPAGTYYKRRSILDCRFWYMPDQLLLRPALLPHWRDELMILTSVGGQTITKNDGTPNEALASDHLPLLFRLNL